MSEQAYTEEDLIASDRAYRLGQMGLKVDGTPFDLQRYPWVYELLTCEHPHVVIRKGAQMGFTIAMILRTIDMSLYTYPRGVLYLMPTRDDVTDFSKTRFDRFMRENADTMGRIVSGTDSINVKRIGWTYVYFRGARSRSQLKSIPVDAIYTDEEDEMERSKVLLAEHRLDGSEFKHHFRLSTPTIPEYGVDEHYQKSDKRHWMIHCLGCKGWTNLETTWPRTIFRRKDGSCYRGCENCEKELDIRNGEWVPELEGDYSVRGYYISQLCSPTVDLRKELDLWESGELSGESLKEFLNSVLGMPHADIEDLLDDRTLRECTTDYPREHSDAGPCVMGVDIGKKEHHWIVAKRSGPTKVDVLAWGVGDYGKLSDNLKRFNVAVAVLDQMAETHAVRQFLDAHGECWGAIYSEAQRNAYNWDPVESKVTVNRTEILDQSHRELINGMVQLPRRGEDWKKFSDSMCNLARVVLRDEKTGMPKVRWVVRGRKIDHYRHAWAYTSLAMEMAPLSYDARRAMTGQPPPTHGRTHMSA